MKAARNMKYYCPGLELLILVSAALALPPTIVLESPATIIYKEDSTVKLDCNATGDPKPTIEWYKNGASMGIESGGRMTEEESALVIFETYRSDEGFYMCKAKNKFGVTMSKTTRLWQAVLGAIDPTLKEVVYDVDEYKHLTVECFTPKVAPNATYSWSIVKSKVDNAPRKLNTDKRIQIDDKGNLHFSHVIQADDSGDNLYKCDVFNPFMDVTAGGSYSQIKVKPSECTRLLCGHISMYVLQK
jgi:roundabout axon guidance receptor 2